MEKVVIVVRDINGKRITHTFCWNQYHTYFIGAGVFGNVNHEDEILLVTIDGTCVYSALISPSITWEDVTGFFA